MSRKLYRDPANGRLGGVCAGLAEYLGVEVWAVRLVVVLSLFMTWFATLVLYLAAWLLLEPKPQSLAGEAATDIPSGDATPQQRLDDLARQLTGIDERLQAMEKWVTSQAYRLRRDFRRL